ADRGGHEALHLVDGYRRGSGLGPVVDHDGDRETLDGPGSLGDRGDDPIDPVLPQRLVLRVLVVALAGGDDPAIHAEGSARRRTGAGELLFQRLLLEGGRLLFAEGLALGGALVEVELGADDDGRPAGPEEDR